MGRGRRWLVAMAAALVVLILGGAGGSARAGSETDDDRAEGRRRFQLGEEHFAKGQFVEAMREYEAGYQLTRLPGFLINIAHCHRMSGDLRKARGHYRKYLLVAPVSPRRSEVEEIIVELDRAISEEQGGADPAAARKPRVPSVRWWLWSALAGSVVGRTVATMSLASAEPR